MDEVIQAIKAEVDAHGFQVVLFPSEGDAPAYGHTVGLQKVCEHPEVVVVGLDEGEDGGLTHDLLESIAQEVVEGRRFAPGDTDGEVLEGHTVAFRVVTARMADALLGVARDVLGHEACALQLVWPDRRGLMPWSPACDPVVRARQPLLDADPA
jgi:hypothetical protein